MARKKNTSPRDYKAEHARRKQIAAQKGRTTRQATGHSSQYAPGRVETVPATPFSPRQFLVGPVPKSRVTKTGKYITPEENYHGARPATPKEVLKAVKRLEPGYDFVRVAIFGKVSPEHIYGYGDNALVFQWRSALVKKSELIADLTDKILFNADAEEVASLVTGYDWTQVLAWSVTESDHG